jgi:protoheme ferro-lyase
MEDPRYTPTITRDKQDSGKGHTAIVYFTHGEPETYSPIGWINQFHELDEHNVPFVPYLIRPFFLNQLRKKYLHVGKSDHRKMHQIMFTDLKNSFKEDGDTNTKFYLSFLDDEPRPDAAVIKALNDGASRIIACEVFVSISNHTAEGEELIKGVKTQEYGVQLDFTQPLWNSSLLHEMFLYRANEILGETQKSKVGILLVGHGQPSEWDALFPTATNHEIIFREQILDKFRMNGYLEENLGLAWMEFRVPKPAQIIEKMVFNGVEKILFYSASISADAIHSMYDVPDLVHKAKIPIDIEVVNMGAWNNHPLVIQALKERIDALFPDN